MKISFDFDGILSEDHMQKLAKKYINDGHDVWVTTSRLSDGKAPSKNWNTDLWSVTKRVGIPPDKVQFTNGSDKWRFLGDFDIHIDDDKPTLDAIEENLPHCMTLWIPDNT